jgi:hypothetical protein
MALPVFDSALAATVQPGTSVTRSKASTGSNRLAFAVAFSLGAGVVYDPTLKVTCDSVPMDFVDAKADPGTFQVSLWKILNPPTASVNYVANFTGSANQVILVATYKDVNQTTPLGTAVTANGTSQTPAISGIVSATDELVIGVYESVDVTGRTLDGNDRVEDGFFPTLALLYDKVGAASSSYSWPQTNSQTWAAIGVSLKGIASGVTGISGHAAYAVRLPPLIWKW